MSLSSVAARGSAVVLAGQAVKVILLLIGAAVLGRVLGPEEFGLIAMVTVVTGVAELFRDFGLSSAAIQAKSLDRFQMSNLFWINSGLGVALALCAVAIAPLVAHLYGDPRIPGILVLVSIALVFSGVQTQFQVDLTRRLMFPAVVISEVASQTLGLTVAIVLALSGAGYWSIASQPVIYALSLLATRSIWSRWRPGLPRRKGGSLKPLLRFGWNLGIAQLLNYTSLNAPTLIIGVRFGPADAGLYSRIYQLVGAQINQVLAPLTNAVFPVLSRIDVDDRYNPAVRRLNTPVSYGMGFVLALAAVNSTEIVQIVLGDGWSDGAPLLAVLSIGLIFQSFTFVGYWVFLSKGISGALLRYNIATKSTVLTLTILGLFWGALGVASGYVIGLVLAWPICWWWLGRATTVGALGIFVDQCRVIAVVTFSGVSSVFMSMLLPTGNAVLSLLLSVLVFAATATLTSIVVPRVRADRRAAIEAIQLLKGRRLDGPTSSA